LTAAAKLGDLDDAKRLYLEARALFGQVAPVAMLLAEADDRPSDPGGNAGDYRPAFEEFRTIRQALFDQATTSGVASVIKQLAANVMNLDKRLADVSITPERLVAGTVSLLDHDASSEATGCTQMDLAEAAADFEGVSRVRALLHPLFDRVSANQVAPIDDDARAIAIAFAGFRTSQTDLIADQCGVLRDRLTALARAVGSIDVALKSDR
jgi:iron uptake system component EfeO